MTIHPHPAAVRRRAGSQAILLAKYEEFGTLHKAYWALVHLHQAEPDRYHEITGSDRLPRYETLHRYWTSIPITQRRAARRRHLRRS